MPSCMRGSYSSPAARRKTTPLAEIERAISRRRPLAAAAAVALLSINRPTDRPAVWTIVYLSRATTRLEGKGLNGRDATDAY